LRQHVGLQQNKITTVEVAMAPLMPKSCIAARNFWKQSGVNAENITGDMLGDLPTDIMKKIATCLGEELKKKHPEKHNEYKVNIHKYKVSSLLVSFGQWYTTYICLLLSGDPPQSLKAGQPQAKQDFTTREQHEARRNLVFSLRSSVIGYR
jgi:hypothetical protein